jgi:hypothetical protein
VLQTTNAPVVVTARKDLDKTKEELLNGTNIDEARVRVLKLDVLGRQYQAKSLIIANTVCRRVHHRRRSSRMQEAIWIRIQSTSTSFHRSRTPLP